MNSKRGHQGGRMLSLVRNSSSRFGILGNKSVREET